MINSNPECYKEIKEWYTESENRVQIKEQINEEYRN